MQPLEATNPKRLNPKVKHLRHNHHLHSPHRMMRGEERTKARLIWTSCGVISTANSAGFLAALMVDRVATGVGACPAVVETVLETVAVFNPT